MNNISKKLQSLKKEVELSHKEINWLLNTMETLIKIVERASELPPYAPGSDEDNLIDMAKKVLNSD